jgi:hypothetical protein
MRGVAAIVPKPPVTGFATGEDQRPHRPLFDELYDVLMGRWPKVRAKCPDHGQRSIGYFFQIGVQRKGNKPPWMVVKGAIVVALMEFVHAQGKTEPKYPSFEIGLAAVVHEVVSPTEGKRAERE